MRTGLWWCSRTEGETKDVSVSGSRGQDEPDVTGCLHPVPDCYNQMSSLTLSQTRRATRTMITLFIKTEGNPPFARELSLSVQSSKGFKVSIIIVSFRVSNLSVRPFFFFI